MDIRDITQEQLDALVLVRSLKEFVTDEHDNLTCLSDVIYTFEEGMPDDERINFVEDIVRLTEQGYLVSDATEEDIANNTIPEVKGITSKGEKALKEYEQEAEEEIKSGRKVVLFENFSLISINTSLLGGIDAGGLFATIAKPLKEILAKLI